MQYSIAETNGTIGTNDTALVANRCYASSPFLHENAVYYGGINPNSNSSTNKARIFKNSIPVNAVGEFPEHEHNCAIYPNPTTNQLFINNNKDECFQY
jgi:hypothetical protein